MPAIGYSNRLRNNFVDARITGLFFDRDAVIDRTTELERKTFSKFGYYTMMDARQRIRDRKKPSKPGQSPTNWSYLLKRFIFFTYDPGQGVIIGPAKLPSAKDNVPEVLEQGGTVRSRVWGWSAKIEPRPYMQPAFDRQLEKRDAMLQVWRDSL